MTVQRQTIVHNVSDEPITVEQTDGSQVTVPARDKRPAELPSEFDFLIAPTLDGPAAPPQWATSSQEPSPGTHVGQPPPDSAQMISSDDGR